LIDSSDQLETRQRRHARRRNSSTL